jgi:hypothetical protein
MAQGFGGSRGGARDDVHRQSQAEVAYLGDHFVGIHVVEEHHIGRLDISV